MGFVYLAVAIVFEVTGTTFLKLSEGYTKLWPSLGMIGCYIATFAFLSLTLKELDVSLAYAIWGGVGIAIVSIIGLVLFNEPLTLLKIGSIVLIIIGVVGLNLSGAH